MQASAINFEAQQVMPQQLLGVGLNAAAEHDDEFVMPPLTAKPSTSFGAYPLD